MAGKRNASVSDVGAVLQAALSHAVAVLTPVESVPVMRPSENGIMFAICSSNWMPLSATEACVGVPRWRLAFAPFFLFSVPADPCLSVGRGVGDGAGDGAAVAAEGAAGAEACAAATPSHRHPGPRGCQCATAPDATWCTGRI